MKKTLLFFIFLLNSTLCYSKSENDHTIKIYGLEKTNFDYKFRLIQESSFEKIELDCQSFFNGLNFYLDDGSLFESYYLENYECVNFFHAVDRWEKKFMCLNVNFENRNMSVDQSKKACSFKKN